MSAAEAMRAAQSAGISVFLDGDDLALKASAEPPVAVRELLSRYKPEIVALLRLNEAGRRASRQSRLAGSDLLQKFGVDARLVEDATDAAAAISELIAESPIGIDIETMPFGDHGNALDPNRGAIRTVQLYAGGREALVIDMTQVPFDVLKPLADVRLIAHNALFETRFLINILGSVAIDCTMLLNTHLGGALRVGLDALAWDRLGIVVPKDHQTADWSVPLTDPMIAYAAADAVLALQLFELMEPALGGAKPAYEAAIAAEPAVAMAMNRGVGFDEALYRKIMDRCARDEEEAKAELAEAVPGINFSNRTRVQEWLRGKLGPEREKHFPRTATGFLKTAKDTLAGWAGEIPELGAYARLNAATGRRSAHAKLPSFVNPVTGRIHPEFNICGMITGRMSSKKPNVQGQEKKDGLRKCYVAGDGKVFVSGDWGQLQLRIVALIAKEERMLGILCAEGGDIHRSTAARVLRKPEAGVTKGERNLAKALNFGLLFGMGPATLLEYAAKPPYLVTLTLPEARRFRDEFFKAYPRLKTWQRRQSSRVESSQRQIATTTLGRRVKCSDQDKKTGKWRFNYGRSLNVPVQGADADLLHIALGKLPAALAGLDACPVLFVHDEIVLEVAEADAEEAKRRLVTVMSEAFVELFPEGADMVDLVEAKGPSKTWGG